MTTGTRYRADDVELLLPAFREVAKRLLERLHARDFEPVPRDTLRSRTEAAANARKGTGITDSMHCYGVAMDVICGAHGWACPAKGCAFFEALGEEAEKLGLTWGGRWRRRDLPHVQAVAVFDQGRIRALQTDAERDAFVRGRLAP